MCNLVLEKQLGTYLTIIPRLHRKRQSWNGIFNQQFFQPTKRDSVVRRTNVPPTDNCSLLTQHYRTAFSCKDIPAPPADIILRMAPSRGSSWPPHDRMPIQLSGFSPPWNENHPAIDNNAWIALTTARSGWSCTSIARLLIRKRHAGGETRIVATRRP